MDINTSTQKNDICLKNEEHIQIVHAIRKYLTYNITKHVITHMFENGRLLRRNIVELRYVFENAMRNWDWHLHWRWRINVYCNIFKQLVNFKTYDTAHIENLHTILCNFPEYKQCVTICESEIEQNTPAKDIYIRGNPLPKHKIPKYERWILCAFLTANNVKQIILQWLDANIKSRNHLRIFIRDCLHQQNKYTYVGNFYDVLCAFLKRQRRAKYGNIHNAFSMFATYRDFVMQKKTVQMFCFLVVCEDCFDNYDYRQITHRLLVEDVIVREICKYKRW